MHLPFLIGEKIYLRVIEEKDLNEVYQQWFNDEEICRFNSHHRFPNYQQDMQAYYHQVIKSKENLILAIIDKDNETHVGNVALENINAVDKTAELAIIVGNKNYWAQGVGYEACQLLIEHGFNALNLHRIYCGTSKENIGMQKLTEKLGFKREGLSREAIFKDGHYVDIINYGLIQNDRQI